MVGTSRRTIYGYEQGLTKASVVAAHNLIWALGIPVARPMNIFETPRIKREYCLLTTAKRVFARCSFLNRIMSKFARYRITAVRRAPFDFIISAPDEEVKIVGGVADENEPELDRRVEEILSISKIVRARPILIADCPELLEKNIFCISSKEISRVKDPQELIAGFK
jgi:predicted transcriptional regulator